MFIKLGDFESWRQYGVAGNPKNRSYVKMNFFDKYFKKWIFSTVFLCVFFAYENDGFCCQADTLMIVFSANTNGQLLDCGCDSGVAGGLPRCFTVIKNLRQKYENILLIDGGDFFGTTDRQLQNVTLVDAYNGFNYDVIAIGDQEYWNGIDLFKKKLLNRNLPILLSNLAEPHVAEIKSGMMIKKKQNN